MQRATVIYIFIDVRWLPVSQLASSDKKDCGLQCIGKALYLKIKFQ